MTTAKYDFVRLDMYDSDPFQQLKEYDKIWRVFKPFRKITLFLFLFAFFAAFVALFLSVIDGCRRWAVLLDILAAIATIIIGTARNEFLYDATKREAVIKKKRYDYEECLIEIDKILKANNINSWGKLELLKKECEDRINRANDFFTKIQAAIYKGFISVPFGLYIGYKISEENKVSTETIMSVILIGAFFILLTVLSKEFFLVSEGYFRDRYLLKTIKEFEYTDKLKRED